MSRELTRERLVERIAEVSHATWLLQGVRDQGRRLANPTAAGSPEYGGTEEWLADCAEAERMLKAVRDDGASLNDLSPNPKHHVKPHDRERAEDTVSELERLGVWPTGE